uniref:Zinc finger, SWIM-type containing 7 n=1 Tax=Neogobius melanostomus TaxID=47308 RepID=A0A8C6S626_9GOBI
MHAPFLPSVAEQLFRDIQKIYKETSQIPDEMLIALKFVYGPSALQALDLVDQRSVTCVSSPSGRRAFQVTGGSGRIYTCFVSCHFCPCPAFAYTVLRRNEGLLVSPLIRGFAFLLGSDWCSTCRTTRSPVSTYQATNKSDLT